MKYDKVILPFRKRMNTSIYKNQNTFGDAFRRNTMILKQETLRDLHPPSVGDDTLSKIKEKSEYEIGLRFIAP